MSIGVSAKTSSQKLANYTGSLVPTTLFISISAPKCIDSLKLGNYGFFQQFVRLFSQYRYFIMVETVGNFTLLSADLLCPLYS